MILSNGKFILINKGNLNKQQKNNNINNNVIIGGAIIKQVPKKQLPIKFNF